MSPIFSRVGFNRGIGKPVKRTQRRLLKKYFQFTSPGTLDLASIPQVQSVDYFSITAGSGGSAGQPGISYSSNGGTGGAGGSSGFVSVLLNQTGSSPVPISVGSNYPTPISGPNPGPSGTLLTIPQPVRDVFSDYTITAYAKGFDGSPSGDSFGGKGGFGGAGGVYFSSNGSLPSQNLPSIPNTSGTTGGTGYTVTSAGGNAFRYGGTGGAGGAGYGGGGGGGGGGAEYDGNTSGGAPGGPGSPGLIVVKVTYLE